MRVALYQCRPLPLDVAGNLQRLREIAQQAEGIDLLSVTTTMEAGARRTSSAATVAGIPSGRLRRRPPSCRTAAGPALSDSHGDAPETR